MLTPFARPLLWLGLLLCLCCASLAAETVADTVDLVEILDEGAPVITSIPVRNAIVGRFYQYDVRATGSPPPYYNLAQGPPGMYIDKNTGLIQWVPSEPGNFVVTVQAINSIGAYVQTYTVQVLPPSEAPSFQSFPTTQTLLGNVYSYDVYASGYPYPTYTLTESPAGMTIDIVSGLIIWNPTLPGNFTITVHASNPEGSDDQTFILKVYEFPVITSLPDSLGTVSNLYTYDVEATGSPAPAFALTLFPNGMTIDNSTGLIEWTPSVAGEYNIIVQAGNPAGAAVQNYILKISDLNDPPTITTTPDTTAVVNMPYGYNFHATGTPDPTYSIATAPVGMTIDSLTGTVSWVPFVAGEAEVTLVATNDAGSISQDFTIYVEQASELPGITSTPSLEATVGDLYSYDVNATGYPEPQFALVTYPSGMTIDSLTGLIEWTPTTNGTYGISTSASNEVGSVTQDFVIDVNETAAPFITSLPVTTGATGQHYYYDVEATGYPSPIFEFETAPSSMTIDSVTGIIRWTPVAVGEYDMSVRARNQSGSFVQGYVITVIEAFQAPLITSSPVTTAEQGVAYQYDVNSTGYPIPTYQLTVYPTGMTIDPVTGMIDWLPSASGSFMVTLVATNSVGTDSQTYMASTSCCGMFTDGYSGNTDCSDDGKRNLADITILIDFVYLSKAPLCCSFSGNIDGDPEAKVNLADITKLIDHVYLSKTETAPCQ